MPSNSSEGREPTLEQCMKMMTRLLMKMEERQTAYNPSEEITLAILRNSLPELPKFSGKREEWPLFHRIYVTTTETGRFTDDLNHLRLVKCLEGEARRKVQSLLIGSASGDSIIEHLKKLYGDPIESLTEQAKKLLAMKSPRDLEKTQLQPFAAELESLVLNAEALNNRDFLKQTFLIESIVEKLRDSHRDWWEDQRKKEPESDLRTLMQYVLEKASYKSAKPPATCCRPKELMNVNTHRGESMNESSQEYEEEECLNVHAMIDSQECDEEECINVHELNERTLFKVLPVELVGKNGKKVSTYAFLDDGSAVTLLEDSLREELGIEGCPAPMKLRWTAKVVRIEKKSRRVNCLIAAPGKRQTFPLVGVRTVDKLAIGRQSMDVRKLKEKFAHLRGVPMNNQNEVEPRLLIGLKNVNLLMSFKNRYGKLGEPVAAKTKLGWVIYGSNVESKNCTAHGTEEENLVMTICEEVKDELLNKLSEPPLKLKCDAANENSMNKVHNRSNVRFLGRDGNRDKRSALPLKKRQENYNRSSDKSPTKKKRTRNKFCCGYVREADRIEEKFQRFSTLR